MEQGILAELLGPQAIADVAMIGMDTFTREGAALGVIFEAKNRLLEVDLVRQRQEALFRERDNGSSLTTVQIAGRDVSFLSTPDNRLRSYYVIDGAYHLVTNSPADRRAVSRGAGGSRIAGCESRVSPRAGLAVPTSREDTIFVYFSTAFFENLLSPQYQIELNRRLRAATDLEHITLARLAARNEGQPGDTLEQLIDANLLPPRHWLPSRWQRTGPDRHADPGFAAQSARVFHARSGSGQSRRSPRPSRIATRCRVPTTRSTGSRLDPLLVAIKRYALERAGTRTYHRSTRSFRRWMTRNTSGTCRCWANRRSTSWYPRRTTSFRSRRRCGEVCCSPMCRPTRCSWESRIKRPLQNEPAARCAAAAGDRSARCPAIWAPGPSPASWTCCRSIWRARRPPDGMTQLLLGIWRWQGRGFSVLSMDPAILQEVDRQIGFEEADDPAQVRIRVGDLSQAQIPPLARFLGLQSRADHFRGERPVSRDLDATAGCAAGRCAASRPGIARCAADLPAGRRIPTAWTTAAASPGNPRPLRTIARESQVPAGYIAPALTWFRGLEAQICFDTPHVSSCERTSTCSGKSGNRS